MVGRLYRFRADNDIYVLINTSLGYVALCITDLTCFGTPKKTITEAVDGLDDTGLQLDLKRSQLIDPDLNITGEERTSD